MGVLDGATAPAGPPWAGAGSPLAQNHAFTSCLLQGLGLPGPGGRLPHQVPPRPAVTPGLCLPSPADVTSPGGEPGWTKEPPSGFREPDLSPGKTDTERLTQKPRRRRRRHHHTAVTTNRTILNPET